MQTILNKAQTSLAEPRSNEVPGTSVPQKSPQKRGDLLIFRPRRAENPVGQKVGEGVDSSAVKRDTAADLLESAMVVIRHGGRDYLAKRGMAECFLRHARSIIASGDSELVPLLHCDGVDLLLITSSTSVDVLRASL